jgi:orotidine-5'-phosphate decarboxylase
MPDSFQDRWLQSLAAAGSPICVGLDPDPALMPPQVGQCATCLRKFLSAIIEATRDLVAAYKPNLAFFEAYGGEGWCILESLRDIAGPNVLLIADGKRGDIEHTNEAYARALFERVRADAVTVQPYLGGRALTPFYRDPRHGAFVLCVTSNRGAEDVQNLDSGGQPLYLRVAEQARTWSPHGNVGLVVGTTKPEALAAVLNVTSDLPLLLPGGGVQGGSTTEVIALLKRKQAHGLFTFSRSVTYASSGSDFAEAARKECLRLKEILR